VFWKGDLLRIAPFDRSLHKVPESGILFQEEYPRTIGYDATPFIDPSLVRYSIYALHAGSQHRVYDEEKQPRTEENAGG
jgi:hypothetical protein